MVGNPQRIFLNASNITGSGASVLVANLLPELYRAAPTTEFTTLLPDVTALAEAATSANSRIIGRSRPRVVGNNLARLLDLHGGLGRAVRASRADVCLTLGDLGPARLPCPHVVFLHNPLFVYSSEDLAGRDSWSPAKRRYLLWQFRRCMAGASDVIVQTPVMRSRLAATVAGIESRAHVISQPVPRHVAAGSGSPGHSPMARCDKPVRLLFLAAHYPHKNHAILPALAAEIRARGLGGRIQIFVTLGAGAPPELRAALAANADVVTDLGPLLPAQVPQAMSDASALFLPTLLESYGLIYLEAMACCLPILTSDRDFARWICADVAQYFDPLNPGSMVDAIVGLPIFQRATNVAERARARLRLLPSTWSEVANQFLAVLQGAGGPAASDSPGSPLPRMFPQC